MLDNIYLELIFYNQDAQSIPAQRTCMNTQDHCVPSTARKFQMPGRILMLYQYGGGWGKKKNIRGDDYRVFSGWSAWHETLGKYVNTNLGVN